ncbi:DUF7344 domain-containing protein [Haloarchaeobius iranensis]|uniref:DUF7344 domain-containing protein n=1 Tax=Haloarchaeobius iranensis TaxID=996166 RepID=A0A1G9YHK2_9EURY|nr:hypothetical protein [Haloarchaeobius iranensis]SDN07981.1 hypothetical protein SAMN05192554_11450 [Haloarchaeobius iranensis]
MQLNQPELSTTTGTEPANRDATLSQDCVFTVLSNARRRFAIKYLNQQATDDCVELRDLAEQIAAWENDIPIEEVTYKQRKRVYTSLYQSHLPKLHELDVVEYDCNRGTIERTEAVGELDVYLEVLEGNEIPWSDFTVGVAAVNVAFVFAAAMGVVPFFTGNGFATAAVAAGLFLVVALAHTVYTRRRRL